MKTGSEALFMFKCYSAPLAFKDVTNGEPEGRLQAVISTFELLDRDGEMVAASAFKDGQPLPLVWAHDWASPIGRGVIQVQTDRAVFDGELFLDTIAGEQAYKTMRRMADLQQFSWGFSVTDFEMVERDGKQVRRITGSEAFEASPVLVGSNPQTGILAIKSHFKALETGVKGHNLSFSDHAERAIALMTELAERAEVRAAIRAKDGRELSEPNRRDLAILIAAHEAMGVPIDTVKELLRRTERPAKSADDRDALSDQPDPPKAIDVSHELTAFLAFEASRNGVAVGV